MRLTPPGAGTVSAGTADVVAGLELPPRPEGPTSLWWASTPVSPDELPDAAGAGSQPGRGLWRRPGLALLGDGEALRLRLRPGWAGLASMGSVPGLLGAANCIESLGPGGATDAPEGPVAMGALPYDPARPGELVVPRLLLVRHGEGAYATLAGVGPAPSPDQARADVRRRLELLRRQEPARVHEAPDGFQLSSSVPHASWKQLVARTVQAVLDGPMSKVVLARRVDVVANGPLPVASIVARLEALYPSCTVFHFAGFVGASPETLVSRHGDMVLSHPLAGTVAHSGDAPTDQALLTRLLGSAKDRHEHEVVVRSIADVLGPLCTDLEVPEPTVVALRNVSHLGTRITGRLRPGERHGSVPDALALAASLQPTPAVGGEPTVLAMAWQAEHEGFDRGLYAGPVGWVDARGDGEWALGLRSATIEANRASLYAGAGIVAGSDPDAELAETQLKLQALLAAVVRP